MVSIGGEAVMRMDEDPDATVSEGAKRAIDGHWCVFYGGYWIKAYDAPADTLLAKKGLIQALTRRLFNHVEHGLNIPGTRLEEARRAFDVETDPQRKRVKGAMLAGALFNRATDVITKVVELQALGVEIRPDDALMHQCGNHLQEALALGRLVLHRSGEEGIDELWGETFKAFAFPIEDFYRSRYIKIAATMRQIDRICDTLAAAFTGVRMFAGVEPLIGAFAHAAKVKCETLHTDSEIFEVWSSFVAAGERLSAFEPLLSQRPSIDERLRASQGLQLIVGGKELVENVSRARVPMPKSGREFIERLDRYRAAWAPRAPGHDDGEAVSSRVVGESRSGEGASHGLPPEELVVS
jgi:hypothetical protein